MAVRRSSGELRLITRPLTAPYTRGVRRIPLLRGVVILIETLVLGMQALFQSANISLEEEEEEISAPILWGVLIISFGFAIGLFFVGPLLFTHHFVDPYLSSSLVSNIIEGVIRIAIFFLYLGAINLVPEVRRIFAYHGAEHKVVNAYEDKAPLELDTVRKYSTAHVRCGTSFLFAVLIIAIFVFALLGHQAMWLRILSRIVLIPAIAAVGYEVTQLSANYADNRFMRALIAPGLALQAMTTRQPNDAQLETAISALRGVIEADGLRENG
jgi:uncharacterized protein YqhQ